VVTADADRYPLIYVLLTRGNYPEKGFADIVFVPSEKRETGRPGSAGGFIIAAPGEA